MAQMSLEGAAANRRLQEQKASSSAGMFAL